jgi:hypothetical protein
MSYFDLFKQEMNTVQYNHLATYSTLYSTNTLIKTTVCNKCFYARFIVYCLQHVSAPIGDHLQVKCTQKYI